MGLGKKQWYVSYAIYLDDEEAAQPASEEDLLQRLQVCTYPGTRLPHAWLNVPKRRKLVSTHDLAGKEHSACSQDRYGEDAWQQPAKIRKSTIIPIHAYKIGFGLEWHDVYRE